MPDDEIRYLWTSYKKHNSKNAREELILNYLWLVKYISGRLAIALPPHIKTDDLINSGVIGLIDAVEKFDPTRKIKFQTYAAFRIKGAILDELRRLDWAPRTIREKAKKIEDTLLSLEKKLNRKPTEKELADELRISTEKLSETYRQISATSLLSLEEIWGNDGAQKGITRMEVLEDKESPDPWLVVEEDEIKRIITKEIENLPDKEKLVVILYYYEGMTLKEIGEVLELSESRISQIHSRVILNLRKRLRKIL